MRRRHPVRGRVAPTCLHPATVVVVREGCECSFVVVDPDPTITASSADGALTVVLGGVEHEPGCQDAMAPRPVSVTLTVDGATVPPLIAHAEAKGVQSVISSVTGRRITGTIAETRLRLLAQALNDPHGWSGGEDEALKYLPDFAIAASSAEVILPIARAGFGSVYEYDLWTAEVTDEQALAWRPVTNTIDVAKQGLRADVTAQQYRHWLNAVPDRLVVPHPVVMRTTADDGWTVEHAAAVWTVMAAGKAPHELPNAYPATIAFCSRHQHRDHAMVAAALTAGLNEEEMVRGLADGTLTKDILGTLTALNG